MKTYPIARATSLAILTATLFACGGGGGGGSPERNSSGGTGYVADDCTATTFNEYMPLAIDTSINYTDGSSGQVSCSSDLTASEGTDIYSIAYEYAGQPLTFYISSTPSSILLWGIDGPIEIESGLNVNYLRFDEPIVVRNGTSSGSAATEASAQVGFINLGGIDISYTWVETDSIYNENAQFGYGDLPIKSVTLITNVEYSSTKPPATLSTTFNLAKGLGIVRHSGSYVDFSVNNYIDSVTGLPEPIWFNYSGIADPALSSPSNLFSINGNVISPSKYIVVNADAINSLNWLSIAENVSSTGYEVDALPHTDLESLSLPYSVEVIFENISTGERLSSNITITD